METVVLHFTREIYRCQVEDQKDFTMQQLIDDGMKEEGIGEMELKVDMERVRIEKEDIDQIRGVDQETDAMREDRIGTRTEGIEGVDHLQEQSTTVLRYRIGNLVK